MVDPRTLSPQERLFREEIIANKDALNKPDIVGALVAYAIALKRTDPDAGSQISQSHDSLRGAIIATGVSAGAADWFIAQKTSNVTMARGCLN